ncbi:L,D-transpeptidase family protein [Shewanella violacea]|uniref:ErfK/YbiS/YcfS/YnhG family protein n=1 Tax=Shewanella violacea (strain JCM 10179 / CIP 106290 / LMG 19151 / DSS12) TaxID=637905 RepID=D4ZJW9_SHEVD|nr:L,D-transpeptidase family protein [Shewanella violacea]BAJ01968.1 ErfK/YbiS/YcfS/YnhG family protein [Shewanella violacea DSS12]
MRSWLLLLVSIVFYLGLVTDIEANNKSPDMQKSAWLYEGVEGDLIWFDDKGITLSGMALLGLFDDLGIDTSAAHEQQINEIKITDSLYSHALLDLLAHIRSVKGGGEADDEVRLLEAINNDELAEFIASILPSYDEVSKIRRMIRVYKSQLDVNWPTITQVNFKLGQSSKQVQRLRWMLTALGDLENSELTRYRESIYDPMVIHGIKAFQRRHGIRVSGELDESTALVLNISPQRRVIQMQQNLWRWLMMPPSPPKKYIKINIPDYSLQLFVLGELDLSMKVIVGKPSSPTPVMMTRVTRMTINPYWTPPSSIIRSELLPLNSTEPGYLNHKGFELHAVGKNEISVVKLTNMEPKQLKGLLTEYRLVQAPGKDNALGQVRFTIPNTQSIYLHDTPAKNLFDGEHLALSHGCIRLEKALALSEYLISIHEDSKEIQVALSGSKTRYVSLPDPMPIFITYQTAWVDNRGKLQLRPDIYHLDRER